MDPYLNIIILILMDGQTMSQRRSKTLITTLVLSGEKTLHHKS